MFRIYLCENKLKQNFSRLTIFHLAQHFFQLYKGKEKRGKEEEAGTALKAEKELLLWLVRLFRMEPAFAFSVSSACLHEDIFFSWGIYVHLLIR